MWLKKFSHFQNWVLLLVWHGAVLLPDVRSSSSRSRHPNQYYIFLALDVGLLVESEAMWEDEWRGNITIASNHFRHHGVDWVFDFYLLSVHLVGTEQANGCSMSSSFVHGWNFLIREKPKYVLLERVLECIWKLCCTIFSLILHGF